MPRHVFGPVPSRRLGRSLGVDLVPFKTCTYDCVYCQLGRTTALTDMRGDWLALNGLADEIKARLGSQPDFITISGSGEPTLNAHIGELIDLIKGFTDVPVAVITNGSLLWRPMVRQALLRADVVIPSLDAGDEQTFTLINRPEEDITFAQMVDGLVQFGREYSGRYWLEVFVVPGINDSDEAMQRIVAHTKVIDPDRVQLNTAVRPPADRWVQPVPPQRMQELAGLFDPPAEVIAEYQGRHFEPAQVYSEEQVLEMLRRRPCTTEDVAAGLGIHVHEAIKLLGHLQAQGAVASTPIGQANYYAPTMESTR